ncbi:MAG: LacI family DNA-binding transcriptional regulator [Ilumatobacteraceae bacterium]
MPDQPTMDDVAAAAGVSRALVSLVMRGSPRVSDHSRAAVHEAAGRLGYRPNLAARNLASGRTSTFGVLLNDLHNPWFADIADGIHDAADAAGYQVIIANGRRSATAEGRAVESFLSHRVDGMILAGCRLPAGRMDEIGAGTAVVSVGRPLRSGNVDTVNTDERLGSELAVRHLAGLGHRDIAHIDGGRGAGAAPRKAGYVTAMGARGLDDRCRVVPGDFTEEAGVLGVEALLATGTFPTAIYTANDLSAIGALDRLEDEGLTVPGDVSLVGFDNTALASLHHIGLTTIDQPRAAMGRLAVQLLLERLCGRTDARREVVPPSIIVRTTSAPAVRG